MQEHHATYHICQKRKKCFLGVTCIHISQGLCNTSWEPHSLAMQSRLPDFLFSFTLIWKSKPPSFISCCSVGEAHVLFVASFIQSFIHWNDTQRCARPSQRVPIIFNLRGLNPDFALLFNGLVEDFI